MPIDGDSEAEEDKEGNEGGTPIWPGGPTLAFSEGEVIVPDIGIQKLPHLKMLIRAMISAALSEYLVFTLYV